MLCSMKHPLKPWHFYPSGRTEKKSISLMDAFFAMYNALRKKSFLPVVTRIYITLNIIDV